MSFRIGFIAAVSLFLLVPCASAETVVADATPTVVNAPASSSSLSSLWGSEASEQRTRVIKGIFYSLSALVVLYSVIRGLRQRQRGVSPQQITIVARRSLNHQATLVIAEVEGRRFLLGQTTERIDLISELEGLDSIHPISEERQRSKMIGGERA